MAAEVKYKVVALIEPCKRNRETRVRVQVCGKGRTFIKEIKELYKPCWLEGFSKEDVAHIGVIVGLDSRNDKTLFRQFSREKNYSITLAVFIAAFTTAFLIIADIGSAKIAYFNLIGCGVYHFPSSVVFFPFVFLLTDVGTELLGFATCRKIIWASFLSLAILVFALQVSIELPGSPHWLNQNEYALILGQAPKIFTASAFAFLGADLMNAYILSKLKELTSGRFFIFRALGSTLIGAFVNSVLFINIAYWGKYSLGVMWNMVFTESIIKVVGEAILLPIAVLLLFIFNKFVERKCDVASNLNTFSVLNEQEN